jgi:hypothetical protein
MTPAERVDLILAEAVGSDLSSWERFEFLPSVASRIALSPKQEAALAGIEGALGINHDGD